MGWAGVGCHGSWGWSKHDHMHWGYHRSGHRVGRRPNDTCEEVLPLHAYRWLPQGTCADTVEAQPWFQSRTASCTASAHKHMQQWQSGGRADKGHYGMGQGTCDSHRAASCHMAGHMGGSRHHSSVDDTDGVHNS